MIISFFNLSQTFIRSGTNTFNITRLKKSKRTLTVLTLKKMRRNNPTSGIRWRNKIPASAFSTLLDFLLNLILPNQQNIFGNLVNFFQPNFCSLIVYKNEFPNKNFFNNNRNLKTFNQPFIFFSYLEGFDSLTTNILLNNHNNKNSISTLDINNYKTLDNKLLTNIDMNFYNKLLQHNTTFNYRPTLYEYEDWVPYLVNQKFEARVYNNYDWLKIFDISYQWATNDLIRTFYYEPFFFFWEKTYQSLEDYRIVCFFWQRALLLDEWVFPTTTVNKKVIFIPLKKLSHYSELKSGLKILKRLYDFKASQSYSYFINFSDIQDYALDKNFLHIWNYWIGARHTLNIFTTNGSTGILNFYREKLYTPWTHFSSSYYRKDVGYKLYNSRLINFGFFPDLALLYRWFNPSFDDSTSGYNWFFRFGETYIDATISLKLIRYQLSYNLWGSFDYLVQDYSFYQPTYFADNTASVRIPMILLVCKNYNNSNHMNMFIRDYNAVFHFKKYKIYKNLKGEIFYPLNKYRRLEKLWDVQTVEQKMYLVERLSNLFYGYNYSEFAINYPNWFNMYIGDVNVSFQLLHYDKEEDKQTEEIFRKSVKQISKIDYNYNTNMSIYFNSINLPRNLQTYYTYINEKLFDDPGYYYTRRNWSKPFYNLTNFTWLENFSLLYAEYIPDPHYNWKISVFGIEVFNWNLMKNSQEQKLSSEIINALTSTFKFGFKNFNLTTQIQAITHRLFFSAWLISDTALYFELDFGPLLCVLWSWYDLTSINNFIDSLFSKIYNFFDQPIIYFYDKIIKILNFQVTNLFEFTNQFLNWYELNISNKYLNIYLAFPFSKFINLSTHIIQTILLYFFEYEHKTVVLKSLKLLNNNYTYVACSAIIIEFRFLPIDFYLPFYNFNEQNYWIIWKSVLQYENSNYISTNNYFNNLHNFKDFKHFTEIWLINELIKNDVKQSHNIFIVTAINNINNKDQKLKSLEYQRFNTYVAKHRYYKDY